MLFLKVHNSSHVPIRRNTWQPFSCSNYGFTISNLDLQQGVERHQQAEAFDGAKKQQNANHGFYSCRSEFCGPNVNTIYQFEA